MSRWAVVIGVNDYAMPGASLQGAVRDALGMCCWLLDPAGGGVPRQQLFVALNPAAPLPDLDEPCKATVSALRPLPCPNKDAIVDLFHRVVQKSGGEGERLYVFFAGHGLQYQVTPDRFESAIVAPDCDSLHPDRSLTISSILEYFEATGFLDQFFFVDACRNVPWTGRFEAGRVSVGPPCPPPAAAPQQFVCLATAKGSFAAELNAAGEEGGAFTSALLRGLSGQDAAKAFDQEADRFVVRWNRLFDFVCADVQRIQRTLPNGGKLVQVPRDEGSKRGANRPTDPLLWSVEALAARFDDVDLLLRVAPENAATACRLTIRDLYDEDATPLTLDPPTEIPRKIALKPRWYRILPQSPGFRYPKAKGLSIELMGGRDVLLQLEQDPGQATTRGLTRPAPPPVAPHGPASAGDDEATTLLVNPGDPIAVWVLTDASGNTERHSGTRRLSLKPGVYRVRAVTPEGAVSEATIDLEAGEQEGLDVNLPGPSLAMQELARHTGFNVLDDPSQRIEVSEALGAAANVELSTALALAGTVATFGRDPGFGRKLRSMNLAPVESAVAAGSPAIMLLFGAESRTGAGNGPSPIQELHAVKVAWWKSGTPQPPVSQPIDLRGDRPAIAQWIAPSDAGHGWLKIAAASQPPAYFQLFVPRHHVLVVVVHRLANGDIGIYLYTPLPGDASPNALRQTRLLDLTERYMLRGRFDYPLNPDELLAARPDDPIGALLAAYLWQRRGEQDRALKLANRLIASDPDWSDPHLIRAEALVRADQAAATDAYHRALAAGIPIFAGGLARLWQSMLRLEIRHPKRAALEHLIANRLPGVLWSATTSPPGD